MKYLLIILSTFLLAGCALTRDHILLNYEPMIEINKIPGAEKTEIYVAVDDKRPNKDRVGCKINGFGMQMASIVCDNQVDELVREALLKELANRGFVLSPQDPQILVEVVVEEMVNRFKLGFWSGKGLSETNLAIKIQNADGSIKYNKTVAGKGDIRNVQLTTGKNAKIALERSLQHAVKQVVEDPDFINALLMNPRTDF